MVWSALSNLLSARSLLSHKEHRRCCARRAMIVASRQGTREPQDYASLTRLSSGHLLVFSFYHARIARRAQHLRIFNAPLEGNERTDNRLDKKHFLLSGDGLWFWGERQKSLSDKVK